MSRTKSFVRGFASTTAQKILTKLIGLGVTPIILSYLNKTEYGIWVIIGSLLGYMGLMNFGITGATTAIVAKSNTLQEAYRINTIVNNAVVLECIVGVLIIAVGLLFSGFFPHIFNMGDYSSKDAWLVFVMAIIGYGISFPPKTLKGLIRARQMIALSVWLEFGLFIITTSLNLYLLYLGFGLLALPIGTIVTRLLAYPVYIIFAKRAYPALRFDVSVVSWSEMKGIFSISAFWFIGMIAAMVIYSTDTILIGMFMSPAIVTIYALTFRLSEVLREFIYSINFTLMPAIGQIMGSGDLEKARNVYLRSQPIILSLAVAGAVFIVLFNGTFVKLWVGEEYYGGTVLSLLFGAILFVNVVFHASSLVISADLKVKEVTYIRIVEALINIVLSVLLIRVYGITGVAAATLVAAIFTSFWLVPYITIKHLKISFRSWLRQIGMRIGMMFAICLVLFFICSEIFSLQGFGIVGAVSVYAIGSVFTIWYIIFDQQTRRVLYARIGK